MIRLIIKSRRVLVLRNFRLLFLNTSKSFTLLFQRKTADVIRLKERFAYLGELKNAISKRMDFRKIILLGETQCLLQKNMLPLIP